MVSLESNESKLSGDFIVYSESEEGKTYEEIKNAYLQRKNQIKENCCRHTVEYVEDFILTWIRQSEIDMRKRRRINCENSSSSSKKKRNCITIVFFMCFFNKKNI